MQDLNNMLYFAEVVDHGGFAAAARALGLPKSTVSRRVAELEAGLGARLLHRTTRKLSLTATGELYFRHCVAMREQAQAGEEVVAQAQAEPRGTVRVACPVTLAQTLIGHLLPPFLERHPAVRLEMEVTNRVVDLVQDGIDVALRVRPTVEDSGSLVVKNLGLTRMLLLASPEQLEREGRPQAPADLRTMSTVAMSAVDGRATWLLMGPGGQSFQLEHRPRYTADDLETLKYAVVHGMGMCLLPDYLCRRDMREGRLVEPLEGWGPPPNIMHAVFPSRRGMAPAVRRFLDYLGENATSEGLYCPQ